MTDDHFYKRCYASAAAAARNVTAVVEYDQDARDFDGGCFVAPGIAVVLHNTDVGIVGTCERCEDKLDVAHYLGVHRGRTVVPSAAHTCIS